MIDSVVVTLKWVWGCPNTEKSCFRVHATSRALEGSECEGYQRSGPLLARITMVGMVMVTQ